MSWACKGIHFSTNASHTDTQAHTTWPADTWLVRVRHTHAHTDTEFQVPSLASLHGNSWGFDQCVCVCVCSKSVSANHFLIFLFPLWLHSIMGNQVSCLKDAEQRFFLPIKRSPESADQQVASAVVTCTVTKKNPTHKFKKFIQHIDMCSKAQNRYIFYF